MPLYYIQARTEMHDSYHLFVREDDPDSALFRFAAHYNILDEPLTAARQVITCFDSMQMFVVPENTCNGAIPWDGDQGVKRVFRRNMGASGND